ncbi:MAG: hypothetical protein V2A54_04105 [Bacteroidota bacterium]
MKKLLLSILAAVICISAFAQSKADLKILLRNGDIISGSAKMDNVVLTTDFGKLDIPLVNVTSVQFGVTADKENESKIKDNLNKLSDQTETIRKAAYDELLKCSVGAIPVIQSFIDSRAEDAVTFTDFNAEGVLSELQYAYSMTNMPSQKDLVMINGENEMSGSTNISKIKLTTSYGILEISRDKIESMEIFCASADNAEKVFKLQASKNISSNANGGWLKTGIMLKENQSFSISANGEVTLASLSNQKYKPDGVTSSTNVSDDYSDEYSTTGSPTYGCVVYKIGETGVSMKAGSKFNGKAKGKGMLYISIYETVYNAANSGSYTVRVKN